MLCGRLGTRSDTSCLNTSLPVYCAGALFILVIIWRRPRPVWKPGQARKLLPLAAPPFASMDRAAHIRRAWRQHGAPPPCPPPPCALRAPRERDCFLCAPCAYCNRQRAPTRVAPTYPLHLLSIAGFLRQQPIYTNAKTPAGAGDECRKDGLPGGTRTLNLLLRRQLLYPVELRAEKMADYARCLCSIAKLQEYHFIAGNISRR